MLSWTLIKGPIDTLNGQIVSSKPGEHVETDNIIKPNGHIGFYGHIAKVKIQYSLSVNQSQYYLPCCLPSKDCRMVSLFHFKFIFFSVISYDIRNKALISLKIHHP